MIFTRLLAGADPWSLFLYVEVSFPAAHRRFIRSDMKTISLSSCKSLHKKLLLLLFDYSKPDLNFFFFFSPPEKINLHSHNKLELERQTNNFQFQVSALPVGCSTVQPVEREKAWAPWSS